MQEISVPLGALTTCFCIAELGESCDITVHLVPMGNRKGRKEGLAFALRGIG